MGDELNAALILTTINDPILLEGYLTNFKKYDHLQQVTVYVIPDLKTPTSLFKRCKSLRNRGLRTQCPTLKEQEKFLSKFHKFEKLVPYNSDNRRNIGFLMALEEEVDFIISIDDDNYCRPNEDFFAEHSIVTKDKEAFESVKSSNEWFNVCDMLELTPNYQIYPRGFPYHSRHKDVKYEYTIDRGSIRMNAGLWLVEPDLDGITWLTVPVKAKSLKGKSLVLGPQTWSPINTQNTALNRDAIACYYFIQMGYPLAGIPIDRYGDIFSGYFCQAVLRHMGHRIRVGTPVSNHRRNAHNYLKDTYKELACILVLEDLTKWLTRVKLEANTYEEAYVSLSYALEEAVEGFSGSIWNDATRGYFHRTAYCMREWVNACLALH